MKVLFINTVIKDGSTGSIIYKLQNGLKAQGFETLSLYGRNKHNELSDAVMITPKLELYINAFITRLFGLQAPISVFSSIKLKRIFKSFNPDAVVLGNIHGYFLNERLLFSLLVKKDIPTFYYMFDEYPYHGKCAYAGDCRNFETGCGHCPKLKEYPKTAADCSRALFNIKKNSYEKLHRLYFLSTPQNCRRAIESPITAQKKDCILPCAWGIDVKNVYKPTEYDSILSEFGLDKTKSVVLSVNPLSDKRKGVESVFFRIAEQCKDEQIAFVHIGNDDSTVSVPKNCISLPYMSDQSKLAAFFSLADLFVMTSVEDTYPTVCLIAQACGTPIAGFNSSGIPDTACPETSRLFDVNDADGLTEYVRNFGKKSKSISAKCHDYALENFDSDKKIDILAKMIKEEVFNAKNSNNRSK